MDYAKYFPKIQDDPLAANTLTKNGLLKRNEVRKILATILPRVNRFKNFTILRDEPRENRFFYLDGPEGGVWLDNNKTSRLVEIKGFHFVVLNGYFNDPV